MKLGKIVEIANSAYPDEFLTEYFDIESGRQTEGSGDGFAKAIVTELVETYDEKSTDEEQLTEAARVVRRFAHEAEAVADALEKAVLEKEK